MRYSESVVEKEGVLIMVYKIEHLFFVINTVTNETMKQTKCSYCHKSGHNIRTCMMKSKNELDKQRHEEYIANHPLSLFPDLMEAKMKTEHLDEDLFRPTVPTERDYHRPNYMHSLSHNIGVFRWNLVNPFQIWVSELTAVRTPSTEYGPEHPVLLDKQYPISYWIYLQRETEITLQRIGVVMKVARSYEIPVNRLLKSKLGDQFVDSVSKHCHKPLSGIIRILLQMTHSLETQLKKIPNIIREQSDMAQMITKTNTDVVPLILSYV